MDSLTWSDSLGKGTISRGGNRERFDIEPDLGFTYSRLYYEPELNRKTIDDVQMTSDQEIAVMRFIALYEFRRDRVKKAEGTANVECVKCLAILLRATAEYYDDRPSRSKDAKIVGRRRNIKRKMATLRPLDQAVKDKAYELIESDLTDEEVLAEFKTFVLENEIEV